jgi:hypothetical protein
MRPRVQAQAKAKRLRRDGHSLRQIARAVNASIGSISVWVRDVAPQRVERPVESPPESAPARDPEGSQRCGRCGDELPLSAFNRNGSGHQYWCRECFRVYFRDRGDLHRRQSAAALRKRKQAATRFIQEYLLAHPCRDCGESDPVVLDFDHVGEKLKELSVLAAEGASIQVLREEMANCQVVCANCHRCRTAVRGEWRRATKDWWKTPPPGDHLQSRNIAFAYSFLERHPCIDCLCSDLCVLEFDHVGEKSGNVLALARSGVGLERLQHEISQCEVRCATCHRRRTAARRRRRQRG